MNTVDVLARIARGDRSAAALLAACDAEAFADDADAHGLLPLVADVIADWDPVPAASRTLLRSRASQHAAVDLVREVELRALVEALAASRIEALVIKGAQLAYTVYDRPDLRPRLDTDLLIGKSSRSTVARVMTGLGYDAPGQVTGQFVSHQTFYVKREEGRVVHTVDVHWRVANPEAFAGLLSFEEVWPSASALPRLSRSARGLSAVDALLLSCVHRVAHHYDTDRLIWLYDIHLQASALGPDEWRDVVEAASRQGVVTVCRRSLERAATLFGTVLPAGVLSDPRFHQPEESTEPTAAFLAGHRGQLQNTWDDLKALPTWRDRWRLVGEHLFPPAAYMRGVYAPDSRVPLAFLYARRALRGARKWLGGA